MISYKHQCIFVHIPRTGDTSFERIIWPKKEDKTELNLWMGFVTEYNNKYQTGGLQHLFANQIRQEVGDDVFCRYFKFAIVRNPWDKAVSQYLYMKKRMDLRDFIGMSEGDSFKKYLSLIQKRLHVQWESQHKFLYDANKKLMVDFVGRFENYKNETYKILDKLKIRSSIFGIRIKRIPHENKSRRSHYTEYYDTESKEIVHNLYKKDIEFFDYTF